MRKMFKNIPIGSIIYPCVRKGASLKYRKTVHLRKFKKVTGCEIERVKDKQKSRVYTYDLEVYWNIVKLGTGPCALKPVHWSRF